MTDEVILLTAQQVSALTGVPVSTLHEWAVRREANLPTDGPPHLRLGERRRRWDRADVMRWLTDSKIT